MTMEIIEIPAPSENPIENTLAIQQAIDRLVNEKKQGIIQFQAGTYEIGYLKPTSNGSDDLSGCIRTTEYDVHHDFTAYKMVGIRLKSISNADRNDAVITEPNNPFITFKGQTELSTTLLRTEIYEQPALNTVCLNLMNDHFLSIVSIKLDENPPTVTTVWPELEAEIETLNQFTAGIEGIVRRVLIFIQYKLDASDSEKNELQRLLLTHREAVERWLSLRGMFNVYRTFQSVYTNDLDALPVCFQDLRLDGNRQKLLDKGWKEKNYQFEQAAMIFIYGNANFTGRFHFNCLNIALYESIADGIHYWKNSRGTMENTASIRCGRGGITVTSTHFDLKVINYISTGSDEYGDGFQLEIDNVAKTPYFNLELVGIKTGVMKLTTGPGKGTIIGRKIKVSKGFAQRGYGCNVSIADSTFLVDAKTVKSIDILSPGNTTYTNCRFGINPSTNVAEMHPDFEKLMQVRMYYKKYNTKNQKLTFYRCYFSNRTSQKIVNAISIVREEKIHQNTVHFSNSSILGNMCNGIHHEGAQLIVENSKCKFSEPDQLPARQGIFVRCYDYSNNGHEIDYGIRLTLIGSFKQINSNYFIYWAALTNKTELVMHQVKLPQRVNKLHMTRKSATDFSVVSVTGKRYLANDTNIFNPTLEKVHGIFGDLITTVSNPTPQLKIERVWRCIKSGDAYFSDRNPKWEIISWKVKPAERQYLRKKK